MRHQDGNPVSVLSVGIDDDAILRPRQHLGKSAQPHLLLEGFPEAFQNASVVRIHEAGVLQLELVATRKIKVLAILREARDVGMGAPTTLPACGCAWPKRISKGAPSTALAPIGLSPIRIWLPTTTKVETCIGGYGSRENIPSAPDGIFQPAPKLSRVDRTWLFSAACWKLGIPCVLGRAAILTQPLNGRAPCHYCNQYERGCRTNSNFSSSLTLIPAALATGRLTIIPYAMAREVIVGGNGRAAAASYIDKATHTEQQVRASFCTGRQFLRPTETRINLLWTGGTPGVKVVSYTPHEGRLDLRPTSRKPLLIRCPDWL